MTPATLTFTPDNWNVAQTVTVSAVDDHAFEHDRTGNISHTAASGDAQYDGILIPQVTVGITDNDEQSPTEPGKVETVGADSRDHRDHRQ
jgi:hypothetical protein